MRAVFQRVSSASVTVDGEEVGAIGTGALLLVCAMARDSQSDVEWMAAKVPAFRVFADEAGKLQESLVDRGRRGAEAGLLVVSQFTLAAVQQPGRTKGNRPSFGEAMAPAEAEALVSGLTEAWQRTLAPLGVLVAGGRFGATMSVSLTNDGPLTFWFDSEAGRSRSLGGGHHEPT